MLRINKFNRMKEIATAITIVAMDTGYEEEFLGRLIDEQVEDGETYEDAFNFIAQVAYEYDF